MRIIFLDVETHIKTSTQANPNLKISEPRKIDTKTILAKKNERLGLTSINRKCLSYNFIHQMY